MKEFFLKISEHLFVDFKSKCEIVQKIREMPLSAKTVKDRTIKMVENITKQQINPLSAAVAILRQSYPPNIIRYCFIIESGNTPS